MRSVLVLDSELFDTANLHDDLINNSRITAPVSGQYLIVANISFPFFASEACNGAFKRFSIGKNGVFDDPNGLADSLINPVTQGLDRLGLTTVAILELNAGDYLEAVIENNCGAPLSLRGTMAVRRL